MNNLLSVNECHDDADQVLVPTIGPANSQGKAVPGRDALAVSNPIGRRNKPSTLEEVLLEITEREARMQRHRFPVSQIRVEPDRLIAGDQEFRLGNEGFQRLCRSFQAPAEYLAKLTPNLRACILQEHFAQGRLAGRRLADKTYCITSQGGDFFDLVRADLFTLDNAAVIQAAREGIGSPCPTLEVQNFRQDNGSLELDVVSPQVAEEVRPGDILHAGVHIEHSPFSGQATQIMGCVVRLLCSNGLVQRQCLGQKPRETPRTRRLSAARPEAREMQMAQVRKLVADTWKGLQERLAAIGRLRDKEVTGVRMTLERFLRQAHLYSRQLMERLLRAWELEGSETSAFGALNALTRVATHDEGMPAWQRRRLGRLAGIYANQDVHLCSHCFSVLAMR